MSDEYFFKLAFLLAIIATICLFIASTQRDQIKSEAVERGHAEYVTDSDGNTTWRWKGGEQ